MSIIAPLEVWFKDDRYYEVSQSNSVATLSLFYELQSTPRDYLFLPERGIDYEIAIQNQSFPIVELTTIINRFSYLFDSLKIKPFNQINTKESLFKSTKILIKLKTIPSEEQAQFKEEFDIIKQYVNQLGRNLTLNGNQLTI